MLKIYSGQKLYKNLPGRRIFGNINWVSVVSMIISWYFIYVYLGYINFNLTHYVGRYRLN